MFIDTTTTIKSLDGKTMKGDDGNGNAIDVIAKTIMVNAVLDPVAKESGVDKIRKYELAKKIYANDKVDLNEEDIKLIKERVGTIYAPLVVGQIFELLKV